MKFDVWNDIVSQSSYFKSRLDLMTLGGVRGGKPEILENTESGGIGMEPDGKKSTSTRYMIDITGTDPLSLG